MFLAHEGRAIGEVEKLYVEDVFSAFTYDGTGAARSIVNGIDLAGKGGLVWTKCRDTAYSHAIFDTIRGVGNVLFTDATNAQSSTSTQLTAFNSDGYTLESANPVNASAKTYVGWAFRKAAKFFDVQTKTHTNGVASTVDLSSLGTIGQVIVKRTDSTGDWFVWHRSLTAGNNLRLNTTAAQSTTDAHLSVSGTTLTIASGMPSGTYIVYAWAHDDTEDGIIQCGTFTGNGSGVGSVTLGWEPQFLIIRRTDSTGSWLMHDTARGFDLSNSEKNLSAQSSNSEATSNYGNPNATGFTTNGSVSATYIYMAIRKGLMRPPTDATKVFAINARTGTGAAATVTAGSITQGVDLSIIKQRSSTATWNWQDRLRGTASQLASPSTAAETVDTDRITAFNMDSVTISTDATVNTSAQTYINYLLKQARGFFDIVGYTGTGVAHTEAHNLGVVPELMIVKNRTTTNRAWSVYNLDVGATNFLFLNTTDAASASAIWNNTAPTSAVFSIGSALAVNQSGNDHIAYLFASCPGVSKVGTYTGTGTTLQIDCGFTSGARFVLIKRIDSTGDWYFWDTARGIVSGNDPYLLLNSTAAEVTNTDYIDPYSAGFEISSSAPAAINASGGTFLYLAIA